MLVGILIKTFFFGGGAEYGGVKYQNVPISIDVLSRNRNLYVCCRTETWMAMTVNGEPFAEYVSTCPEPYAAPPTTNNSNSYDLG